MGTLHGDATVVILHAMTRYLEEICDTCMFLGYIPLDLLCEPRQNNRVQGYRTIQAVFSAA
jgi:hypothetical protein